MSISFELLRIPHDCSSGAPPVLHFELLRRLPRNCPLSSYEHSRSARTAGVSSSRDNRSLGVSAVRINTGDLRCRSGSVTPENDMRRALARGVLRAGVAELDEINIAKEAFARAEEHRAYRYMQLIDESGAKILLNSGDAPDRNVFPICGSHGSLEGAMDSVRPEMERRSALHRDRFARVMSKYECGNAKRRRLTPPALPGVITPRPSNGPEHVPADNEGANVTEAPSEEVIVDSGCSFGPAVNALDRPVLAEHALERRCGEGPFGQRQPADALRILEALMRAGTESVDGNGCVHSDLGHGFGILPLCEGALLLEPFPAHELLLK